MVKEEERMTEEDEIRVLKCLGNEIRYRILKLLEEEERSVSEITEELEERQTLISHHLRSLQDCGLIEKRREGRKRIYRLADPQISKFLAKVSDLAKDFCQ
ncbi:hypothetical protein AKJ65_06990 [candidate division MSBL1 archaeon SCGC-AAA259E19]|uniref:HTH arsR-type domain-containing protein n=1 Tax=candidate division MSBL1 archaeon SCGC-AAA259E19 TaxID=1698264 RepID=A0A133UF54_9EURY|nr:hypothetical protein AKJ65_06990 [candidate division MSBL1 archaeon SCGC-AAA259E19]